MPRVYHLCSQIQNSSRARFRRIAVPDTKLNRSICQILVNEGFVSGMMKGDEQGPYPVTNAQNGKPAEEVPYTPDNIARRKLWLDLKYRFGDPVLSELKIVSKPSRKVFATAEDLKAVAIGQKVGSLLKPSTVGQITILDTPYGVVELKDALRKNVGGEVLCIAR